VALETLKRLSVSIHLPLKNLKLKVLAVSPQAVVGASCSDKIFSDICSKKNDSAINDSAIISPVPTKQDPSLSPSLRPGILRHTRSRIAESQIQMHAEIAE
jgi:hypothetical protein